MQESKKHRTYDRQFKEEAIRLVTEGGRSVSDVAHGLGIHENLLHTWDGSIKQTLQAVFLAKDT